MCGSHATGCPAARTYTTKHGNQATMNVAGQKKAGAKRAAKAAAAAGTAATTEVTIPAEAPPKTTQSPAPTAQVRAVSSGDYQCHGPRGGR